MSFCNLLWLMGTKVRGVSGSYTLSNVIYRCSQPIISVWLPVQWVCDDSQRHIQLPGMQTCSFIEPSAATILAYWKQNGAKKSCLFHVHVHSHLYISSAAKMMHVAIGYCSAAYYLCCAQQKGDGNIHFSLSPFLFNAGMYYSWFKIFKAEAVTLYIQKCNLGHCARVVHMKLENIFKQVCSMKYCSVKWGSINTATKACLAAFCFFFAALLCVKHSFLFNPSPSPHLVNKST